eukprot:4044423-Pyramimonas_sp.AAC.1
MICWGVFGRLRRHSGPDAFPSVAAGSAAWDSRFVSWQAFTNMVWGEGGNQRIMFPGSFPGA